MADPNKALLGHISDKDTPFTPPTTPRQVKMSIDSTLSNAYKKLPADTTKKEQPADSTVKGQPALISPISPDFNIPTKPQEPDSNPSLVPDSVDTIMEEQAADTTVKDQHALMSSLSPTFDTSASSPEPNTTPDLVPDSTDGENDKFDHWNDRDDDWGPMSQDSMETFYLENFGSKEREYHGLKSSFRLTAGASGSC